MLQQPVMINCNSVDDFMRYSANRSAVTVSGNNVHDIAVPDYKNLAGSKTWLVQKPGWFKNLAASLRVVL